jgi:SH3 domain-binding glutamic acid-rich protein
LLARLRNCIPLIQLFARLLILACSEEAVECETLETFLRLNEDWKPFEDDKPAPEAKPIGVAGAYSPLQMNPKHKSAVSPGPSPAKRAVSGSRGREINTGTELSDYGLEDVTVNEQDLMDLVSELIGAEDAGDLLGKKPEKSDN